MNISRHLRSPGFPRSGLRLSVELSRIEKYNKIRSSFEVIEKVVTSQENRDTSLERFHLSRLRKTQQD